MLLYTYLHVTLMHGRKCVHSSDCPRNVISCMCLRHRFFDPYRDHDTALQVRHRAKPNAAFSDSIHKLLALAGDSRAGFTKAARLLDSIITMRVIPYPASQKSHLKPPRRLLSQVKSLRPRSRGRIFRKQYLERKK